MDCWCTTNRTEKTAAIKDAQSRIANLNAVIEETAAKSGLLSQEIKHLEGEIDKNQQSHKQAQAVRLEEQEAFQGEEKDMLETLDALDEGLKVLGRVNGERDEKEALIQLQSSLAPFRAVMQKDLWDLLGDNQQIVSPHPSQSMDQMINEVFMKPHEDVLVQQQQPAGAVSAKSYNSRSGQIFGILKQMKETFEGNLSDAQKAERVAQKRFAGLSAALNSEIKAATDAKNDKASQLADSNQQNAQAKEDIADTKAALSADERFQIELEERCATADSEFAERQKTRNEEIQAVSETIGFLRDDESHDLFSRTFNFIQNFSTHEKQNRATAAAKLLQVAKKNHNYLLANLAVNLKLDAFTRVKKAMDDMVVQLQKEQKDEFEHREWCNAEIDANEDTVADRGRFRDDTESQITDLSANIETLKSDSETLRKEVSEMQVQLKRAGEDRAKENQEFQTTVADQRATVRILQKALSRLRQFYAAPAEEKPKSMLQKGSEPGKSVGQAPKQATYEKNRGAGGVMGMIQMIISDAERMEAEALKGEQDSQSAYAAFVTSTNASVRAKQEQLANKAATQAQTEVDLASRKEELNTTMGVLEKLQGYNGELHRSCDFVLKNFSTRQTARQEEIEAIQEAKAILSGSNFGA